MKIKAKKGCVNPECVMCQKKEYAHKDDSFCPKCGASLLFVCEQCHTVLDDGTTRLCICCQAKKDDAKERRKDVFNKVSAGAIAAVATISSVVAAITKKR